MAEYIVKILRTDQADPHVPKVEVSALTEFEAAAKGLNQLRERGEQFSAQTGVEILQGNVTGTKPIPVKDILYWLRNRNEGQTLARRDGLQPLLDYVNE
jgi:hypothetical protein